MNIVRKLNLMVPWSVFSFQVLLFFLQGKDFRVLTFIYREGHLSFIFILSWNL